MLLGQHDKAVEQFKEALRLDPSSALSEAGLIESYIHLNRFDDARAEVGRVQAAHSESPDFRMILYELAFLEKDEGKMREQVNWATGKAGAGYQFLFVQATTQAYKGQLQSARELVRQKLPHQREAKESLK